MAARYRVKKFGGFWRVLERKGNLVVIHYPRFKKWPHAINAIHLALLLEVK